MPVLLIVIIFCLEISDFNLIIIVPEVASPVKRSKITLFPPPRLIPPEIGFVTVVLKLITSLFLSTAE